MPQRTIKHNHLTRDVKPEGVCPACDAYREAFEGKTEAPLAGVPLDPTDDNVVG